MASMYESDLTTSFEETNEPVYELKAVQAARMSTLVLALLTTLITIVSQ